MTRQTKREDAVAVGQAVDPQAHRRAAPGQVVKMAAALVLRHLDACRHVLGGCA
ncbi:MAG: hypothetical protein AAGA54_36615 [Myxococcota bacterium]